MGMVWRFVRSAAVFRSLYLATVLLGAYLGLVRRDLAGVCLPVGALACLAIRENR
jgi:hypothetical protein